VNRLGRRSLLVAAAMGLAVAGTGCGDEDPQVVELVVPSGTADRLAEGEEVVVLPAELHLNVGDVLRIRNEDDIDQEVGPWMVEAGGQFELRFGAAGSYQGVCPLAEGEEYLIEVEP
jgi:hypothetical protein